MSIHVERLHKEFNLFTAVDRASFTVEDGEFVTMLGPSGSGKSTILRCIAGLETADDGSIEINGEDVTNVPVQERNVGFVFQHYALFRHMTLLDNIAFGLRVRGVAKRHREDKARELLDLVGLAGYDQRFPSQLSGGQRQRVALARALAPEPKLLLLDEPFGALDTRLRKELRAWLRRLHDRIKLTTLLVTHDQDEAFELSDRVIVTNRGRIEQDAHPRVIFDKPATEFVATFVGEANRVEGPAMGGVVSWGVFRFPAPGISDGRMAVVLFRPNDVVLTEPGSVDPGAENPVVAGEIRSLQFLGATVVVEVAIGEDQALNAHVPKGVAEEKGLRVGKSVAVRVAATHVFAKEEADLGAGI